MRVALEGKSGFYSTEAGSGTKGSSMRPLATSTTLDPAYVLDALSRAVQRGHKIANLEIAIGFEAFVELVFLMAGKLEADVAGERPMIASLRTERRRAREERIRSGLRAWGKPGSALFGVLIRCDAELDGWQLEVAVREGA
jgi:hypothetical protein